MITSNVSFESNVQVIDANKKVDKTFLSHVYDYEALSKLRDFLGGSNTSEYIISGDRLKILNGTHRCVKGIDPCWGIVVNDGKYESVCKCVVTDCEEFSMCRYGSGFPSEEEIEIFSPNKKNLLNKEEYDYDKFVYYYSDMLSQKVNNDSIEYYSIDYEDLKGTVEHTAYKVNLFDYSERKVKTSVNPDIIDEPFIEEYFDVKRSLGETVSGVFFKNFVETNQDTIIQSNGDECILVDAGPGTGKTYTLIKRLIYMVDKLHADPEGIMVLCFTHSAVDVITDRLKEAVLNGSNPELLNIDVRTFHSFAWWLIGQANEQFVDDGWCYFHRSYNSTFDGFLSAATGAVNKFGAKVVENWEHFIVDEIQDLTNERASFVLSLVSACVASNCGMTLFGDSCQAIYDYEASNRANSVSSEVFYRSLFNILPPKTKYFSLTNNYRQTTRLIDATTNFRNSILEQDVASMKNSSLELIARYKDDSIKSIISLDENGIERLKSDGTLCLLTRNNGEALMLSTNLLKKSIAHNFALSNTEQHFALWISDVFQNYKEAIITYDDFCDLFYKSKNNHGFDANYIWDKMQRFSGSKGNVADVKGLLSGILSSRTDCCEFYEINDSSLIVSNIHRSKGKEFDSVIVDLPFCKNLKQDKKDLDEYKVMYVAATRPRTKLLFANTQLKEQRLKKFKYINRWGKEREGKIRYLEFNGFADLDLFSFAKISDSTFEKIKVGGSIRMERRTLDGTYDIIYEPTEEVIGNLVKESNYLTDLKELSKSDYYNSFEYPIVIDNLFVSGVYSRIIDLKESELPSELQDTAHNGVWKWIEIIGAGYLQYGEY